MPPEVALPETADRRPPTAAGTPVGEGRRFAWARTSLLLVLLGASPADLQAAAVPAPQTTIKGSFNIPVSDAQGQIRTLFSGKEMKPIGGGLMAVTQFRMTNREPALTVEAPECILNTATFEVRSAGALRVSTPDNSLALDGIGFQWLHEQTRLIVSNQVRTRIQADLKNGLDATSTPATPPRTGGDKNRQAVQIDADRLDLDARDGSILYTGQVRLADPSWTLACDRLSGTIPAGATRLTNAVAQGNVVIELLTSNRTARITGNSATYHATPQHEHLAIDGKPAWESGPYRGSSDRLEITSSPGQQDIRARGNGRLALPRPDRSGTATGTTTAPGRVPATAQPSTPVAPIEIQCDDYDFRRGVAQFRGRVRAADPGMSLSCELLTATLAPETERLAELLAEQDVRLAVLDSARPVEVTGERVRYISTNGLETIEITGQPTWNSPPFSGSSTRLAIALRDARDYNVRATDNARVRLPRSLLAPSDFLPVNPRPTSGTGGTPGTPARAPARAPDAGSAKSLPDFIEIQAHTYELTPAGVTFSQEVVADHLPGRLSSDHLIARFAAGTNRLDSLTAQGHVELARDTARLRCGILRGESRNATGQLDHFDASQGVQVSIQSPSGGGEATSDRATFDVTQGDIRLLGGPVLQTSDHVRITGARELVWNIRQNRFSATGPFTVEGAETSLKRALPTPAPAPKTGSTPVPAP